MSVKNSEQKLSDLIQYGILVLESAGIADARIDSELLLGFCLGKSRSALYLCAEEVIDKDSVERFYAMLDRRKQREPLSYITGEREFWSREFKVSPAVLIPRPETEFLLETVLARRNRQITGACLDLCCGSGVIAVVLALELNRAVTAVDISFDALQVSAENINYHGFASKISLVQADLMTAFRPEKMFSLIVSNPPYIKKYEIDNELEPEITGYEPHLALDGGESGLDVITSIKACLPVMLAPGGDCFIEIGDRQGTAVRSLFIQDSDRHLYEYVNVLKDYSDRDRVIHIRRSSE